MTWQDFKTYLNSQLEISHGNGRDNKSMEGARGVAVALVFLVHFNSFISAIEPKHPISMLSDAIGTVGNLGVDMFFVLSGFLIYKSLIEKDQPYLNFLKRRAVRIYPTFIAVLLIYLILSFKFPERSKLPVDVFEATIYVVQNILLLPGIFSIPAIITVAWSLSYEMFYYIAAPVVIRVAKLKTRAHSTRLKLLLSVLVFITPILVISHGPVRLIMFIVGMLIYEAKKIDFIPKKVNIICVLALVALIASVISPGISNGNHFGQITGLCMQAIALFFLGYTSIYGLSPEISKVLNFKPLRWLGNMSYSYYLIHGFALQAIFLVINGFIGNHDLDMTIIYFSTLTIAFPFSVVIALALFLLIERPFSLKVKHPVGAMYIKSP